MKITIPRLIKFFYRKRELCISKILRILYNASPFISVGKGTLINRNITLNVTYPGRIKIGKNCELRKGCQLWTYGGDITIGDHSSVNAYTMIYGQGSVKIGNYVRIATQCVIIPSNHIFSDRNVPITYQDLENKGIIIEDDVWIGAGVRILDGVTIARGCVIGAGSVVTKSTEEFGVYVGVPARLIKKR
ncbi:acyltransferase [uncultured Duncaniella sp.]|jgi:acetyltransferase-like isoleucine patch superfamily enzyme|uniref:acyltransferase n=1 Tax=uncultured Duncaniella sp. TaxID=2768039 RepID=UPI000F486321|nr:acyltransferase [uncultured Duncaniella sp.]ROS90307.1 acyltransferase [Muribaculaceae bacterium Isolate-080 (Janvier)]